MFNNLVRRVEGQSDFVTYAKRRVKKNLNFMAIFTGSPGIGKTYAAIQYAYELDPEFDPQKQITFSFTETMKLTRDEEFMKKKVKVILWDEPQISISNRKWQSKLNQWVNSKMSTWRSQNIILLMAAPYMDFLDSQTMKLMHCNFKCGGWDKNTKKSIVYPILLEYNQDMKKFYYHKLYVKAIKLKPLSYWYIRLAPKAIIDVYEIRKKEFQDSLDKEIIEEMEPKKRTPIYNKPLTEKQRKVYELRKNHTQKEVAEILGLTVSTISEHEIYARKKGYMLPPAN